VSKKLKLFLFYGGIVATYILILIIISIFDSNANSQPPVFQKNENGLIISVDEEPYLTKDKDTKKIIINIPVSISNTSDHGFNVDSITMFYNNEEYVTASGFLFIDDNVDEANLDIKYSSNDKKEGIIKVHLDTRDEMEVKSVQPIFSITDMSTDKEKEIKPDLKITPK
jgi:hypothetical protein